MIKVLYILDTLGMGGGKERQLTSLLKEIKNNNEVEPYVIILYDHVLYKDFEALSINYSIFKKKRFLDFRLLKNLIKAVDNFKLDIIHSWEWYSTLAILPAMILKNTILINGSIRNAIPCNIFSKLWLYSKLLFPFSDFIVANSKAGLEAFGIISDEKYKVVYNGFDLERVRDVEASDDPLLKEIDSKFIIGMVARFYEQKDHITLIRAVEILLNEGYDLSLVMIGGGDTLNDSRKYVDKLSSDKDRFIFLGPKGNVEQYICIFDICVLSTNVKIHHEGISNSIMEYMASLKPVVATRSGGNCELVEDGVTGFLVEPSSPKDMADKIRVLIEDENMRKAFGQKGYEKIKNTFSLHRMYSNYMNLYKEALLKKK